MFNILVADSAEQELNHLIFLLEDYKANHPEFDRILNIIDSNNIDETLDIIEQDNIDILFISSDMDRVAFEAYKKNFEILIISVSNDSDRLKKWYIDHLKKPLCGDIFNLRLRSYLDILVFKKVGIQSYERRIQYDLNIISNLHLFWENHFTIKANQNEIIHTIYSLGLFQIDRGIASLITVVEEDHRIRFILETKTGKEFLTYLDKIERKVEYKRNVNHIEFEVILNNEEVDFNEKLGEYEDFALEYMNYDRLEILNEFLVKNDIFESQTNMDNIEKNVFSKDVTSDNIETYINKKHRTDKKLYIFLDGLDLKIFGDLIDSFETLLINNSGDGFSIDEVEELVDLTFNISQILSIYPSSYIISSDLTELSKKLLTNAKQIEKGGIKSLKIISKMVENLSDWRRAILKRERQEDDFIDGKLINSFKKVLVNL